MGERKSEVRNQNSEGNTRKKFALLAMALCASLLSAQVDTERQLEAAIHREVVAGDLNGAIEKYSAILRQADAPRAVAARALLQIGECHERMGQRRQAHDAYTRLARDFAGESAAGEARDRLANWTEVLPGPRNLNFEEGEVGKAPPGWIVLTVEKTTGKLAELRRKGCRSGIGCVVVIAPATAPGQMGQLMQSFSAAAYRGKTVRLRAWLKVEAGSPGDRADMWLREVRPNGKPGFFADLDERAVRSAEWTSVEITGTISRDAQFLDFWFSSVGLGRVWVDSVSFEVVRAAN